ncbi:25023_t:CDS:2 [Gigaspora rosea]|nr:25023_t:CDS:2 [Gigaspora rosea]
MTKHKKYIVTLISPGSIIQDLHFGSFSRNWWLARPDDNSTCISLYPIWVGMKTLTTINNKDFIITVVRNEFKPGYICHSDGIYSEICENSTTAITSVYQCIFSVATKHAGPLIMGFDQHIISDQLLSDITFHPFSFKLAKLNLLIFGIGKSNNPEWNYGGKGYKSSFIWNYQNSRALFVQEFKNKKAIVRVYQTTQEVAMFKNTSPNTVWQQIGILSQYTGLELFGLAHKTTYKAIKEIPSCTILDWNNKIFEKIYSKEQVIEEREWRAWKALLNHSGCTKITPYSKEQSDINPTRLTRDKLETELEKRKIDYEGLKRNELVNILQEKMTQEILSSDSMAREGLFDGDEIPKLITIANWISGYAKKHRQDLAKQSFETSEAY